MIADAVFARLTEEPDEIEQVLALLRAAGCADAERLSLSAGDRRLLEVHADVTGKDLELTVPCPVCTTLNSITIGSGTVPPASPRSAWWGPEGGLREPTYEDLQALPVGADRALDMLLARCTMGTPPRPATPVELGRVDEALTGPVRLGCLDCGSLVEVDVDVQRLVVGRLVERGRQVEVEVHLLARTYHWDLATIEALPDRRRRRLAQLIREDA